MCGLLAVWLWGCGGASETKAIYMQADFHELRDFRRPLQDRLDALPDSLQQAFVDSLESISFRNPFHQLAVLRILQDYAFYHKNYAGGLFYVNRELELLDGIQTDGSYHPDSYFRRGDVFF